MATDGKVVQKVFGEVLRAARTEREISQQDLALEADLDRTYISLMERGLRQPTLSTLIALADAMGIEAASLVQRAAERLRSRP
ncbi:helix-turn-helix domain-containing protein [Stenotrophomonas maltophilia]|uniref:helix-turn-helix domain-containing protein n=1 Tax=Stenotrophomonas maltophilia TaxID=40324 RepID=UPI001604FC01